MADPAPASVPTPAPDPAPAPVPAWHQGIEPETIGYWQNKGLKLDDPKTLAVEVTKFYREAEKRLGAPADQLLRLPRADAPEAEVKAFWQKIGAPADAKEYDFKDVKFADGSDLDDKFVDAMRDVAGRKFLTKEAAAEVAKTVVRFMDAAQAEEVAANTTALAGEEAKLKQSWGQNYDRNKFTAQEGARLLGFTKEQIDGMEAIARQGCCHGSDAARWFAWPRGCAQRRRQRRRSYRHYDARGSDVAS